MITLGVLVSFSPMIVFCVFAFRSEAKMLRVSHDHIS